MNPPKYSTPFPVAELRKVFRYDETNGHVYWKEWRNGCRDDMRADGGTHKGRPVVTYKDTKIMAHRLAWALKKGVWPEHEIDHEDRNPSNNRWKNLREATHSENHINSGPRFGKKYKGVSRAGKRWRATVQVGYYETPEEAARAYDDAVGKVFGPRAYRNF